MINYEKLTELFQEEEFKAEASVCTTMDEFYVLFNRHGLDMSMEEVVEVIGQIAEKQKVLESGELGADELDEVAGGFAMSTVAFCIIVGVGCAGAGALSAYVSYQALKWANKGK